MASINVLSRPALPNPLKPYPYPRFYAPSSRLCPLYIWCTMIHKLIIKPYVCTPGTALSESLIILMVRKPLTQKPLAQPLNPWRKPLAQRTKSVARVRVLECGVHGEDRLQQHPTCLQLRQTVLRAVALVANWKAVWSVRLRCEGERLGHCHLQIRNQRQKLPYVASLVSPTPSLVGKGANQPTKK